MADDFLASLTGIVIDKKVTVKDRLLVDINLQKQAAQARVRGEEFRTGERAFHEWFFQMSDGWWSYLKLGHTAIRIKGRNGFKAGQDLPEVVAWYDQVADTVRIGALDAEIAEAMERRKEPMKGKKGRGGKKAKLEVAA